MWSQGWRDHGIQANTWTVSVPSLPCAGSIVPGHAQQCDGPKAGHPIFSQFRLSCLALTVKSLPFLVLILILLRTQIKTTFSPQVSPSNTWRRFHVPSSILLFRFMPHFVCQLFTWLVHVFTSCLLSSGQKWGKNSDEMGKGSEKKL